MSTRQKADRLREQGDHEAAERLMREMDAMIRKQADLHGEAEEMPCERVKRWPAS